MWDMHRVDDLVLCLCTFNGHLSRHFDGFGGVHGGYSVGQKTFDKRIFFFPQEKLCVECMA